MICSLPQESEWEEKKVMKEDMEKIYCSNDDETPECCENGRSSKREEISFSPLKVSVTEQRAIQRARKKLKLPLPTGFYDDKFYDDSSASFQEWRETDGPLPTYSKNNCDKDLSEGSCLMKSDQQLASEVSMPVSRKVCTYEDLEKFPLGCDGKSSMEPEIRFYKNGLVYKDEECKIGAWQVGEYDKKKDIFDVMFYLCDGCGRHLDMEKGGGWRKGRFF